MIESGLRKPNHERALISIAIALVLAAIAGLAIAASEDASLPPATVVLMALALASAHREAVYSDETAVSGSMVVVCACIVGLGDQSLAAPMLCGLAAALHREHLRDRQFLKLAVNCGATMLPALGATLAFRVVSAGDTGPVIAVLIAVAIYWLANNAVVGVAIGLSSRSVSSEVLQLIRSDTVMLAFGFGGALCGVVMTEVGLWAGMATLVALLVALDVFVISVPAGLSVLRSAWAVVVARGLSGGVAGTVGAVVTRSVAISVLGAIAGLAAGLAAGVLVVVLIVGLRLLSLRRGFDPALIGGVALVELAFPAIGAIAGVVTAVAGLAAGLVCASALVVAGSIFVAVRRRRAQSQPAPIDDDTALIAVVEALLEGRPAKTHDR
jgi:hypothetical protein